MFLPEERNVALPPNWLLLELPEEKENEPKLVYVSPKGARFEEYESVQRYLTVVSTK